MKFYSYQFTVTVPNDKFIVESARGTVRTATKLFTSPEALQIKLKYWTSQGWTYHLSNSDKINNQKAIPSEYKESDKFSYLIGFDEHNSYWLEKVTV
jgi:hypothetical protein